MGVTSSLIVREGADHFGELQAWDVKSMRRVWTTEFKSHNWGPVLATAGGLVFMGGTNDRYFRAFDAATGKVLWEHRTNSGVIGVPTSFAVNGIQYIAVQAGWGVDAQRMQRSMDIALNTRPLTHVPQGGVVWVFAVRPRVS
jgi:alcohol dehydrogenase (cytochrome c)